MQEIRLSIQFQVLRQMRKLNWDDEEVVAYAIKCLTAVWNMRYNSVHCMANLLAGLAPYHVSCMDTNVMSLTSNAKTSLDIRLFSLS